VVDTYRKRTRRQWEFRSANDMISRVPIPQLKPRRPMSIPVVSGGSGAVVRAGASASRTHDVWGIGRCK
jgi:hypothetical protein